MYIYILIYIYIYIYIVVYMLYILYCTLCIAFIKFKWCQHLNGGSNSRL